MATVPSPRTWADNDALTSTVLNAEVRDPLSFLLNPPHAQLRQTVAQTFTNGTGAALTLGAEDVDDDVDGTGGHDNSTNNSRYTARYPGWYRCSGGLSWAANATGRRGCWWAVNGTTVTGSMALIPATAANEASPVARTIEVYLNAGDYAELIGYQDSGANRDTSVGAGSWPSTVNVEWVSN